MRSSGILALVYFSGASCGSPANVPTPSLPSAGASTASCLATSPPVQRSLSFAGVGIEIGERTFVYASRWGDGVVDESVIVSLDGDGNLVETPINVPTADPKVLGADSHGLLVISVPHHGTGNLVRISVTSDGRLLPGANVPLPDVAWGWPSVLTSDGSRATLRHSLAAPDQTIAGEVVLTIDLATYRVVASRAAPEFPTPAPLVTGPVPKLTIATARTPSEFWQRAHQAYLDGVIEVVWDGGHTMAHSPTDTTVRRYFEHWYFAGGQIRLLRFVGDAWTSNDPVPLALHDADGTMHTGYTPIILRNHAHAAVLLSARGGSDGWFQPYRAPCTTLAP